MLDPLETKWRAKVAGPAPAGCTSNTQFFAWDEDQTGQGAVICIGANYSQLPAKAILPTKMALGSWFSNYRYAAVQVTKCTWNAAWRSHQWLAGINPPLRPRFFIMTNLVPWITIKTWTALNTVTTDGIVRSFQGIHGNNHLLDLHLMFPDAFVVGHGINVRTLPYLHKPVTIWPNWMLYANLTYRKTPSKWNDAAQRFMF